MILLDTSGLIAALFPDQRLHAECANTLRDNSGPFVLSPFVLAEVDYLILKFSGVSTETAFLEEVASEAYFLAPFGSADISAAKELVERFDDLRIGLADASIAVLARRWNTLDVLTLDERHFRVLHGPNEQPFRLLPADG